jgi:hypothetical protein
MSTPTPPGAPRPRTPRAERIAAALFSSLLSAAWWRERRSWLARLFRRRRTDPRPERWPPHGLPDLIDLDVPDDTFSLETPALGEAYYFVVGIRCRWSVQGTATADIKRQRMHEIRRMIDKQRPILRDQIETTVRKAARKHAPYRAAAAEKEIGEALQTCKAEGDLRVNVRARVDVCEAVREDLKPLWQHRLVKDTNVELIGELQEAWRELLLDGLKDIGEVQTARTAWIAPYALALAQDPEASAAAYLRLMIDHRVSHAEELLKELSDLVVDKNIDAIEFAFGSDSALHALLSLLGVPIRPRGTADGESHGAEEDRHA